MARNKYGTTWWGQKWLDSLTGIDNANRIPRGLTYARNDSVFGLKINTDEGTINAHVVGKYCPYYKVSLKFNRLSKKQCQQFIEAASKDLAVISGLANRQLAPRLFDIANELGIKLFPTSWHDIGMKCSCPDIAVPCKHIAAVIYVVSEFIDTNPIMYFKLLGIDIMSAFESMNIFSDAEDKLETPNIATLFRESLLLPNDIVIKARENNFELNLNPISHNDAQVLFLADGLINYEEDQGMLDHSVRKHLNKIKSLEAQCESLEESVQEQKAFATQCAATAQTKFEEYEELKSSCGDVPNRGRQSARTRAILQLLTDTESEYQENKAKADEANNKLQQLKKDLASYKSKLSKEQKLYDKALASFNNKTAQVLKLGYDPELLEQEQVVEAKIRNADGSEYNPALDDLSQIDDYSDENVIDAKIVEEDDAESDEIDVRRYQGTLVDLEKATYQQINDMGSSILSLYADTPPGFTHGSLKALMDRTISAASHMASAQLKDVVEREIHIFNKDILSKKGQKIFADFNELQQVEADNFSKEPFSDHGFFARQPIFFMSTKGILELTLPFNVLLKARSGTTLSNLTIFPPEGDELSLMNNLLKEVLKEKELVNRHVEEYNLEGLYNMFSGYIKNTNMLSNSNAETNILYCLWFIATNLVKNRAIAPRLVVNYEGNLQVYWYPATCSDEISTLVTNIGLSLQGFEHFLFNRLDRQYYLEPKFLGEMVLVPFIQSYLAWAFAKETRTNQSLPELQVIFNGRHIDTNDNNLEEKSLRYRLENYLATSTIHYNNFTPVLRFTDLSDPMEYSGTVFSHLKDQIIEQALASKQEQMDQMLAYAKDTKDKELLSMLMGEGTQSNDDVEYYEDEEFGYEHIFEDCSGVGMEFGLMDIPAGVRAELIENGDEDIIDATGFISLCNVVDNKAFNEVRRECLRLLSRLSAKASCLEELYSSKFNVSILPLNKLYKTLQDANNTLRLMGVRVVLPKSLTKLATPYSSVKMDVNDDDIDTSWWDQDSFFSLADMINFDWSVAIGNHALSRQEFNILLANAGNVVRFKDQFIYADPDLLEQLKKRYDRQQKRTLTKDQVLSALLTGDHEDCEVIYSDRLRKSIDKLLSDDNCQLPEGLNATLRPYQVRGYEWLIRNTRISVGSILADDMGLGKTIQVIAVILKLKQMGKITPEKPALVVVPTSLLTNWTREVAQFAPDLTIGTYYGGAKELAIGNSDIILTSYGTARSRIKKLKEHKYSLLVVDEAQAIKSLTTAISKNLRELEADQFIAMSGTPVENRLLEYFSILDFVNRGLFGTVGTFKDRFATPIERNHDMDAVERFKKLTAPFIMRRLKTDKNILPDLPDKIVSDQFCELTPSQASLYQAIVNKKMKELEMDENQTEFKRRSVIITMIQNLKAICNSPAQFMPDQNYDPADSGKVTRLLELLDEIIEAKGKVLVFTQSVVMGKLLQDLIEQKFGRRPNFIYGGLSRNERSDMVDTFQNDPSDRIMLLSLRAAGTGLNLTAANYVIHYDLWWNPAVENQATDRAYRIGQKKNVQVYRFICSNTFEERINDMLNSKKDLADVAVATGESWIGNMSDGELDNLFSLHK